MYQQPGKPTSAIDVLIANDLPLHREALASTFRAMRPDIVVHVVAHDELELLICELRPLLVICSAVSISSRGCTQAWITLYPDDRDEAVIHFNGARRILPNATVRQLIDVMDEVRASRP